MTTNEKLSDLRRKLQELEREAQIVANEMESLEHPYEEKVQELAGNYYRNENGALFYVIGVYIANHEYRIEYIKAYLGTYFNRKGKSILTPSFEKTDTYASLFLDRMGELKQIKREEFMLKMTNWLVVFDKCLNE